jgi:hypothetical protein
MNLFFGSAFALLATIYIFYTIPLTAASKIVDPESIREVFPRLSQWTEVRLTVKSRLSYILLQ